jgi:hypothetical protein
MSASLTIDPAASAAWAQAAQRLYNETTRTAESVLQLAGLSYAQSGRNATPAARKGAKRKVEKAVVDMTRPSAMLIGPVYPYAFPGYDYRRMPVKRFTVLTQKNPPVVHTVPDIPENAAIMRDLAPVPNVKAGKNSWFGIMRSLGKVVASMGARSVGRLSFAFKHKYGGEAAVTIINQLSYLLKIAPGVDAIAKRNAAKQINIRLDKLPARGWL